MHYSHGPWLDSPPPTSQFRRPWSPDPHEPLPSIIPSRDDRINENMPQYTRVQRPQYLANGWRREGSDVSIEALDLADYARTLLAHQNEDPYPSFDPYMSYPPSTVQPVASRNTLQPPSLVSRGETISSNTHSSFSRAGNPLRRPFSLPPPSRHNSATSHRPNRSPYLLEPQIRSQDHEIDISHFPAWSRKWYQSSVVGPINSSSPDIYTPLPVSQLGSTAKKSPFDPGYIHKEPFSPWDPYDYAPASSLGHDSTRGLLPWSNEEQDYGPPIDPTLKQERIRMLEREFGAKGKGKGRETDDFLDENGNPVVGTVDEKGNLITHGPKKRIAVRILQILMALAASIPSIYAALVIKPKEKPPPSGKPPAFTLYIFSIITLLLLLYLFIIRPCCCRGKRRRATSGAPLAGGMMVLPVQGIPSGKKGKRKKGRGKGKGSKYVESGDVQVNLIVDPEAFGRRDDESNEDDDDESIPGAYDTIMAQKRNRRARRRSVFAGLAMEEEWKRARAWAKKLAIIDAVGMLLWGAVFIFILIGKRCPSGSFEGWCNAYNVSSAAACLLCIAFGVSTFFNVKDLHASRVSPRIRP